MSRPGKIDIRQRFRDGARLLAESERCLPESLEKAIELLFASLFAGGKVLVCGNGGSAADAQHLAAELVGRVRHDRRALPAVALSTDTSALTAIGNDQGFERIFARQMEALASDGDVLVAISTSGESSNVLAAAASARRIGCHVVALTGEGGGALAEYADALIAVPSRNVARVQEVHGLCIHVLAESIEDACLKSPQGGSS